MTYDEVRAELLAIRDLVFESKEEYVSIELREVVSNRLLALARRIQESPNREEINARFDTPQVRAQARELMRKLGRPH